MAFSECGGNYDLFAPKPRCRQPPLAGLLASACGVLAVLVGYLGSRLGRRGRSQNDA